MKRIWVAIIAFALVISLCVVENILVNKTISDLQENISLVQDYVKSKDIENANITTQKIDDIWENKNKTIEMLIAHDQLEPIQISIAVLKANLETEEYNDFIAESNKISAHLESLKDTESPTINNIL